MSIHVLALLVGLFGVPGWLAWYGHRLRGRSQRGKAGFWGAVFGHSIATVVLTVVVLAPPVVWIAGTARELLVYWVLLAGAVAGALGGLASPGSSAGKQDPK